MVIAAAFDGVTYQFTLRYFEGYGPDLFRPEVGLIMSSVSDALNAGADFLAMNMHELFFLHEGLGFFQRRAWFEMLIQHDGHLALREVLREMAGHRPDGAAADEEAAYQSKGLQMHGIIRLTRKGW